MSEWHPASEPPPNDRAVEFRIIAGGLWWRIGADKPKKRKGEPAVECESK